MDDGVLYAIGGAVATKAFDLVASLRKARADRITTLEARLDEMARREDAAQEATVKVRLELQELRVKFDQALEQNTALKAQIEELLTRDREQKHRLVTQDQTIVLLQDEILSLKGKKP